MTSHDQDGASGEDGENNTEVEYVVEEIDSPGCIFDSDTSPLDVYQLPVISGPHISQQTAHSQPATSPQHNSQQTPHHLPVHDVPPHFKAPPPAHRFALLSFLFVNNTCLNNWMAKEGQHTVHRVWCCSFIF